jgi:UDP-N-acetylglucosamine 2-epimerase (non-hydrolysing)
MRIKSPPKVLTVFGTRPEAIKLAPFIYALHKEDLLISKVCVTGQHRAMLDQVLDQFQITPEYDLNLMDEDQSLAKFSAKAMAALDGVLQEYKPDLVVVQGDTSTTFIAALCAYYQKIPVFHIEAGLRTDDLYSPWPEEGNRRMVSAICQKHFVASERARRNLLKEGVANSLIELSGNTVIDSLLWMQTQIASNQTLHEKLRARFAFLRADTPLVLITAHRREHFGLEFENIAKAILQLAQEHPEIDFVFAVHPNPNVKVIMHNQLSGMENIHLLEPLSYAEFVYLFANSYFVLSDSGGLQEEGTALGIPILLMRDKTERPEAVEAGGVLLVGADPKRIIQGARSLFHDKEVYAAMAMKRTLFGDGHASSRIVQSILNHFSLMPAKEELHA